MCSRVWIYRECSLRTPTVNLLANARNSSMQSILLSTINSQQFVKVIRLPWTQGYFICIPGEMRPGADRDRSRSSSRVKYLSRDTFLFLFVSETQPKSIENDRLQSGRRLVNLSLSQRSSAIYRASFIRGALNPDENNNCGLSEATSLLRHGFYLIALIDVTEIVLR